MKIPDSYIKEYSEATRHMPLLSDMKTSYAWLWKQYTGNFNRPIKNLKICT